MVVFVHAFMLWLLDLNCFALVSFLPVNFSERLVFVVCVCMHVCACAVLQSGDSCAHGLLSSWLSSIQAWAAGR